MGAEGEDRGCDGWMASPTQWIWVCISSGSSWWRGKPGMLQSMGLQRVGHNWATELNQLIQNSELIGLCLLKFRGGQSPGTARSGLILFHVFFPRAPFSSRCSPRSNKGHQQLWAQDPPKASTRSQEGRVGPTQTTGAEGGAFPGKSYYMEKGK